MILALVFVALVNLLFCLSYKHLATAIRVKEACEAARKQDEGLPIAMAAGVAMLEVEAEADLLVSAGPSYRYQNPLNGDWYIITYNKVDATHWTVNVQHVPRVLCPPEGIDLPAEPTATSPTAPPPTSPF